MRRQHIIAFLNELKMYIRIKKCFKQPVYEMV